MSKILEITNPQPKKEQKFKEACRKYVDGEASIDYLLHYIKKERLIRITQKESKKKNG